MLLLHNGRKRSRAADPADAADPPAEYHPPCHANHSLCRYGYKSIWEVEAVVANYSAAGLPLETIWTDVSRRHGWSCRRDGMALAWHL